MPLSFKQLEFDWALYCNIVQHNTIQHCVQHLEAFELILLAKCSLDGVERIVSSHIIIYVYNKIIAH